MSVTRLAEPLLIDKGVTFRQPFLMLERELIGRPVTAVSRGMPTRVTVPAHGLPDNWPAWLEMSAGCSGLNRPRTGPPFYADVLDADTIQFQDINTTGNPSVAGSMLIYQPPRDLSDLQAVEFKLFATETGELLDTWPGAVTELGTVELVLTSAQTETITWTKARFKLLFTEANGDVTPQLLGDFTAARRL